MVRAVWYQVSSCPAWNGAVPGVSSGAACRGVHGARYVVKRIATVRQALYVGGMGASGQVNRSGELRVGR